MGMFDYIDCDYPLPDGFESKSSFQTKDLDNWLNHFRITYNGRLTTTDLTNIDIENYTGYIDFYGTNICISSPIGHATENDEPYYDREYRAVFECGYLTEIILIGGQDETVNVIPYNRAPVSYKTHITCAEYYQHLKEARSKQ